MSETLEDLLARTVTRLAALEGEVADLRARLLLVERATPWQQPGTRMPRKSPEVEAEERARLNAEQEEFDRFHRQREMIDRQDYPIKEPPLELGGET